MVRGVTKKSHYKNYSDMSEMFNDDNNNDEKKIKSEL